MIAEAERVVGEAAETERVARAAAEAAVAGSGGHAAAQLNGDAGVGEATRQELEDQVTYLKAFSQGAACSCAPTSRRCCATSRTSGAWADPGVALAVPQALEAAGAAPSAATPAAHDEAEGGADVAPARPADERAGAGRAPRGDVIELVEQPDGALNGSGPARASGRRSRCTPADRPGGRS